MIEFDVETQHLQWTHDDGAGLHMVGFRDEAPDTITGAHPSQRRQLQRCLNKDTDGYEGWNTKFDLHCLREAGYALPPDRLWNDGMVRAHIIDERTSVALKIRGEKLFGPQVVEGQDKVKAWLKDEDKRRRKMSKDLGFEFKPANYSDVPLDIIDPYLRDDLSLTANIGEVYTNVLAKDTQLQALYDMEMDVMRALFWMEDRGIPMDREALVLLEAQLVPEIDRLEQEAKRIAEFDNFNVRSPKQIAEALDRLKADTAHMTRTGKTLKTDEENLTACDHPLAEAVLAYRGQHKLYAMLRGILHTGDDSEKFPHAYLTENDRVHPNFRQIGARTGRMSCSNPNFQQVPRDDLRLRYAVAAGEGKKLVTCDLDSIELRVLAMLAGDGALRNAIIQGKDPHTQTAEFVGLTGRRRSTGAVEGPRDQGKRLNYLIAYCGGVRAIRKWFGVSQDEARSIFQRMHRAYPEFDTLQNRIEFALEDQGYVKSPVTGRRFRLQYDIRKEGYKFRNYLVQGTSADIMKIATARAHKAGVPLVAAVHDELIAEVDEADAEEAAREIEKAFTDFPELTEASGVPITAESQIVDRWSDAKKPGYVPDYAKEQA